MKPEYNRQLHALLTQTGLTEQKPLLVESFSGGRETSSKELKDHEAIEMIKYLKAELLKKQQPANNDPKHIGNVMPAAFKANTPGKQANTMRKKIIALGHQMGWSGIHPTSGNKIADMERINAWCVKYGYLHKQLNDYTILELPKLVTQFDNLYKTFLNALKKM
jgi:hypothetical protein